MHSVAHPPFHFPPESIRGSCAHAIIFYCITNEDAIGASQTVVPTLMPSSSMVISLNSRGFSLHVARTMRKLYAEERYIRPRTLARWRRVDANPV